MQKQLGITGANPTGTAGPTAVNGTATTFMRSDGAPAIDQSLIVNIMPGGRLTLTTGTPITTADVTAAGTLYYTPFAHDKIPLYNGATWELITFAELSISLSGYTASKPYDVWVYNNSGTATLETTIWTDATTRATALAWQDGRLVKSGAATRLYLGTIYISATSQTEDSAANRFVWNRYNQVLRHGFKNDTTASWTYGTATWRQARAQTTNQISFVCGLAGVGVEATYTCRVNAAGTAGFIGVGVNSVTPVCAAESPGSAGSLTASGGGYSVAGYNYIAMCERGYTSGTNTFYSTAEGVAILNGITSRMMA